MKHCDRCGGANDPSSRFCVSCGYRLEGTPGPAALSPPQHVPTPAPQLAGAHAPVVVAGNGPPPSAGFALAETAPPLWEPDNAGIAHAVATAEAQPAPVPGLGTDPPRMPVNAAEVPGNAMTALAASVGRGLHPLSVPPGAPQTLVAFLASYELVEVGQAWPIYQGKNAVGRQGAATGLQIEIAHPTTSSVHATLHASANPGRVILVDEGSTNGTFVNDAALSPGHPHELRDGDRVRFGLFTAVAKII